MPLEPTGLELERFLQARDELSDRFLEPSLQAGVLNMRATSITEAAVRAGRNIHAVGIDHKVIDGVRTEDWCVSVHVIQKVDPERPEDRIPDIIGGVITDVVETPPAFFANCAQTQEFHDPVVGGVSTGRNGGRAGTIACFCHSTDPSDTNLTLVLSNHHVFLDPMGSTDQLFQQAHGDGALQPRHFADLHRAILNDRVDGAVGRLRPEVIHDRSICTIGNVSGTVSPSDGMSVRKHGRSTGLSEGTIRGKGFNCSIGTEPANSLSGRIFRDQIRIEGAPNAPFARRGDSGSLVVRNNQAVGLLFAVPRDNSAVPPVGHFAFANPIGEVLSQLRITII